MCKGYDNLPITFIRLGKSETDVIETILEHQLLFSSIVTDKPQYSFRVLAA